MIGPEVFQGVAANQPGDGGTQNSENKFYDCYHTRLLLPQGGDTGRIDAGCNVYILDVDIGKSYRVILAKK
jgi:hypothetical protein